ncbi:DUF2599 domain-containing protein [Mycobacterium simiae]|uniref:DUF2599 domain-containing protein n=1 Tax=Mycobacterium simiae TaxID=1784 RepID=UPI0004245CB2|nr:DUF2599 domain-containing protein [Mycobacterium simiae]PLV54122.1 hypothetical protein X011_03830 [Mycobacterium tuberculosis variant microti OV254]BBX40325.1 hypothetical protein MSIM_17760 [Mycobacterium simiae]
MKVLIAVPAAVALLGGALVAGSQPGVASAQPGAISPADPGYRPPFVDHTEWASEWSQSAHRTSLRVFPTPSGRLASTHPGTAAAADEAWSEVVTMAPDADTPGMRAQFICHWEFAETAQPGKTSWNLEPWRPVVDDAEMVASGCNPGGPEEAL